MARSSSSDPVEKFRFVVTILDNDTGIGFTTGSGSASIGSTPDFKIWTRGGFSEVVAPRVTTKDISYRENIHGNHSIKQPGLATYTDVVLKRGSTASMNMYNWYRLVNDSSSSINKFQDALAGLSAVPFQEPNFRREVLISSLDRAGNFVKHWLLYNAWPKEYKGADDFNAASSEISVEEIVLAYELFIECKGNSIQAALSDATLQAEQSAKKAAGAALIGGFTGLFG